MTNEELKELVIAYGKRNHTVTMEQFFSDIDIYEGDKNIKFSVLKDVRDDEGYRFIFDDESFIYIYDGKLHGYTNQWTSSNIATLKVLCDGKEDLL